MLIYVITTIVIKIDFNKEFSKNYLNMTKKKIKFQNSLNGKTISIPFNNDLKLINKLGEFLKPPLPFEVFIYFAPNPLITGNGRKLSNFKSFITKNKKFQSQKFDEMLINTLKECKKYGFKTNLLMNNIMLGMVYDNKNLVSDIKNIQNYLEKLYKTKCLDRITIGNPYLLELINYKKLKNLEVKTSVNFQIKNAKTIEMLNIFYDNWLRENQLTCIEIQKDLLRDFKTLKQIRREIKNKIKFSIIINEGCITGCPYQIVHQVYASIMPVKASLDFDKKFKFAVAKCKHITCSAPWKIFDSNWILPKHLKYYKNLIDEFKLTDRNDSTETILNTVKAYTTGEYDKENLCKLISLLNMENFLFPESILDKEFFKKITTHKKSNDLYFKKLWRKLLNFNKTNNVKPIIKLKGLQKEKLHNFIGSD